jgi:hypothetical protein
MSVPAASLTPPSQPPRRPRRRPPKAWFLSRTQVQAVIYHPKVQWVMTRLRIRRWLTIRRWPPLLLAGALTRSIAPPPGPRWHFTPVAETLGISIVVIALSTDAYLTHRARRLAGLRSRPAYLAMAAGPLALAVVCIYIAAVPLNVHHPRLSELFTLIGALSGWMALLALGRALTWGRLRRFCWIYPPARSAANTQP